MLEDAFDEKIGLIQLPPDVMRSLPSNAIQWHGDDVAPFNVAFLDSMLDVGRNKDKPQNMVGQTGS